MKKHQRSKEEYEVAIKNARSIAEALRNLGLIDKGGNYRIIKHACETYNIDTSHFEGQGWNKGLKFNPNPVQDTVDLLKENCYYQTYKLKKRLLDEGFKEHRCECCNNTEWNGKPIPLEIHHINGNSTDNRLENIQMLCPNCHAQTDNYRGRNKHKSASEETPNVELP